MHQETVEAPPLKDRSTALTVVGALLIAMGLLSLLLFAITVAAALMMRAFEEAAPGMFIMWPMVALYAVVGPVFITLGIGSIMARRWAWKLTLAIAWAWLASGIGGLLMLPMMHGAMHEDMPGGAPGAFVYLVVGAFFLTIYVLVPGVLVLLYGSPHVRATCAYRDPQRRWTDSIPVPVLVLCLFLLQVLFGQAMLWTNDFMFPFFGTFLSHGPGFAAMLLSMGLMAVLIWGQCRLRPAAWWGALLFSTALLVSAWITYWQVPMAEIFAAMEMPPEQLEMTLQMADAQGPAMLISTALWALLLLGLQLYNKRYFSGEANLNAAGDTP